MPVIELRVVSLPPTISRIRLPRYSCGGMFLVLSPCASIEMRSGFGGAAARWFQSSLK